jgi:hypothetical protein
MIHKGKDPGQGKIGSTGKPSKKGGFESLNKTATTTVGGNRGKGGKKK